MKIKNEKKALQMFCADDDILRQYCLKPYYPKNDNNVVVAADARIMLIVDKNLVRGKYEKQNIGLPAFSNNKLNKAVRFDDIEAAYKQFKLVPEMVAKDGKDRECPECYGTGTVEYEYTCDTTGKTYFHECDCPVCEGSGICDVEMVPTGKMLLPPKSFFRIDGVIFKAELLWKAVEGLRLMGFDSFIWQTANKYNVNMFDVAEGIRFVIMPVFFKQWGTYGEDGVKRNVKANGCTIDGQIYQEWPKVFSANNQ